MIKKVLICWLILVAYIFLLDVLHSFSYAEEVNYDFGVALKGGNTISLLWESKTHRHAAKGLMIFGDNYFGKEKKISLGVELFYNDYESSPLSNSKLKIKTNEYGFNTVGRYYFRNSSWTKRPYIGLLGGFSILSNPYNQPDFGNSGTLGTFGGLVGYDVPFENSNWSMRIEARATHTSDPFRHHDSGRNLLGITLGLKYNFYERSVTWN